VRGIVTEIEIVISEKFLQEVEAVVVSFWEIVEEAVESSEKQQ
jgi:hypothetical protein